MECILRTFYLRYHMYHSSKHDTNESTTLRLRLATIITYLLRGNKHIWIDKEREHYILQFSAFGITINSLLNFKKHHTLDSSLEVYKNCRSEPPLEEKIQTHSNESLALVHKVSKMKTIYKIFFLQNIITS